MVIKSNSESFISCFNVKYFPLHVYELCSMTGYAYNNLSDFSDMCVSALFD